MNIIRLNSVNIEVNGKLLYGDIGAKLFSIHHIPNVGDTFEIWVEEEERVMFQVISKHYIFAQVPSTHGYWDQSVILRCKPKLNAKFAFGKEGIGGFINSVLTMGIK